MSFWTPLEEQIKTLQDLAMTDPIVHAELNHMLASDPQGAHEALELLQAHRAPRSGVAAQGGTASSVDLETLKLQSMMDRRARMFEMISNVLKKTNETAQSVINNIR